MPFQKGDPNINRNGRPKNAEAEMLRLALLKEGEKRGESFWEKVAQVAFIDKGVMIAVIKKFIPDMNSIEATGEVNITQMPKIIIDDKPLELNIGDKSDYRIVRINTQNLSS
jgi:hypothetical protein